MRIGAALFAFLLRAGGAESAVDGATQDSQTGKSAKKTGGFGFLERVFEEVKRVGAALDPDAVAQAEQSWKILEPDLRRAADEVLQTQEDLKALRKEANGVWSDVQRAVSGVGKETAPDEHSLDTQAGLEWKDIKRDAAKLVKGVFGEVLGDVTDDIVATFEDRLSEALSEGNIRAASKLWRRLLDTPGAQLLARDRRLLEGVERVVRRYLSSYMSEDSALEAERAVNATAAFALHFAGQRRNALKSDYEIFQELSSKMCHLQGAAEKLWPLTLRALPLLGYGEYVSSIEGALRANALSRITLTVSASSLLEIDPRGDPFLMTLIASFSLGHLTMDVAQNLAAFFQKAFMDPSFLESSSAAETAVNSDEGKRPPISPVELATSLVSGSDTCEELGRRAFAFFEVVKRALAAPDSHESTLISAVNGDSHTPGERAALPETPSSPQLPSRRDVPRAPRKLEKDGFLLQQAILVASLVDHPWVSLGVFLAILGVGAVLCSVLVFVWWRRSWGGSASKRAGVKTPESAQKKVD